MKNIDKIQEEKQVEKVDFCLREVIKNEHQKHWLHHSLKDYKDVLRCQRKEMNIQIMN